MVGWISRDQRGDEVGAHAVDADLLRAAVDHLDGDAREAPQASAMLVRATADLLCGDRLYDRVRVLLDGERILQLLTKPWTTTSPARFHWQPAFGSSVFLVGGLDAAWVSLSSVTLAASAACDTGSHRPHSAKDCRGDGHLEMLRLRLSLESPPRDL